MLVKGPIVSGILVNVESGNDSLPDRHQAFTRTNVDAFSIERIGTDFSEILSILHKFSLKKNNSKFCLQIYGHFVQTSMCRQFVVSDKSALVRVMQKQLLETVLTKIFVVK